MKEQFLLTMHKCLCLCLAIIQQFQASPFNTENLAHLSLSLRLVSPFFKHLQECTFSIDQFHVAGFQGIIYSLQLLNINDHLGQTQSATPPQNSANMTYSNLFDGSLCRPTRIKLLIYFISMMKTDRISIPYYNSTPWEFTALVWKCLHVVETGQFHRSFSTISVYKTEVMEASIDGAL